MKIYLSHASSFDFQTELYKPLMASPLWNQHTIILPHASSYDPIKSKAIIEDCDFLIAEISYPSTGSGIELGWAHAAGVRVATLYRKDYKPSSSVKIVTHEIFSYDDFLIGFENILKK